MSIALVRTAPELVRPDAERLAALRRRLVRDDTAGHFSPARERLLSETMMSLDAVSFQQRLLAWLRDNVHAGIPRAWYRLVLGHDLHTATWATLHLKHWHAREVDPFCPDQLGWLENVGLVSAGKITAAFRDFEASMLVTISSSMASFKYHEVGTDATAEANTQTALIVPSGIARVAGTQTNPTSNTYQTVATVTANATQTWQEHGVFNAVTGPTLLDRSVLSPTIPVVTTNTVQFTYTMTCNAEA